jgi:biopolymer transport protein ExbB
MDFSTLLTLGGPVVYILIILSIYATAIIFYKLHIFYKVNFFNNVDLEKSIKLWVSKEHNQAYDEINKSNDPQTEVVSFTMYQLLKHKKLTSKLDSDLREEITRLSDERITYYSSKLNSLQVIAAIAPLLGLLGTVFGMIEAFQQMEIAGKNVDPSILSGGIWEALLTTAAGLSVAIPIVIFESYFRNLVDRFKANLENAITKVMTADLN